MKILLINLLFIYSLKIQKLQHECVLGVRAYPLLYRDLTHSMEFKLKFKSNCSEFPSLNYFILPFNNSYKLSKVIHPKKVILKLNKRVYIFHFYKKHENNKNDIKYMKMLLKPSQIKNKINVEQNNNLILRTSTFDKYTEEEI